MWSPKIVFCGSIAAVLLFAASATGEPEWVRKYLKRAPSGADSTRTYSVPDIPDLYVPDTPTIDNMTILRPGPLDRYPILVMKPDSTKHFTMLIVPTHPGLLRPTKEPGRTR
jgi:hypothetical protein